MPRANLLSDYEKGRIDELRSAGKSLMEIGNTLKRSKGCIQGYITRRNSFSVQKKRGRPCKITSRGERQIKRALKQQSNANCRQLKSVLSHSVSRWTIYRLLKRAKYRWVRMHKRPKWSEQHLIKRRAFGRKYQTFNSEWRSVIFSDEKKFNLDGPDGFKFYWHKLGDAYKCYSKRSFGGKSLMVWAGFAYGGKLDLQFIKGTLNATKYQTLLEQTNLDGQWQLIAGSEAIFQQDNAPIHTVNCIFFT